MDDWRVCAPLLAESDAQNNPSSTPNEGSVTDADKVINTDIGSSEVEATDASPGEKSDEDLLKNLLADDYCHVCEAMLLFESQRLSHYEGKRHAQRVRVYLQAKRAENTKKEDAAAQRTMTTDKDHFCELCNMVFSSHVVAKSHYEGKVHAKNIRKQGLQTPDRRTEALPADEKPADKSAQDGSGGTGPPGPAGPTSSLNAEVDPKDSNKYCSLCAASFNNPHMAAQHYNGRKHQRNLSRQELLKGVQDHIKQAKDLMCHICGVRLNSVEMYQAHMQGNKHLSRQKKVIDLCKSQQKAYGTFADELSDYIQIQKARGINPRLPTLPPKEQEEETGDGKDSISRPENVEATGLMTNVYTSPYPSPLGCYNPAERCPPPHLDPSMLSHSLNYDAGPPLPFMRRKRRKPSASSSSYSSSDMSSTSDSEDSADRDEKRGRGGAKRPRHEESEKEKSRKWCGRGKPGDPEERKRKTRKSHSRQRGQDRRRQEEDAEPVPKEQVMDDVKTERVTPNHKDPEQEGGETDEAGRHKNKKEKKKIKGEMDTRTEEERLWDESILGF